MLNKVLLIGNLGKDPETRYTPNGKAVTRFSLATSNTWTDSEGKKQQATEWHNIIVWGKQGEACKQYLQTGRQVYVEGSLRYRSFDGKDGQKRYVTEIVAQKVKFLGSNGKGAEKEPESGTEPHPADSDDDIPF